MGNTEIRSDEIKYKRKTTEEIKFIIEKWRASKLSKIKFCRQEKLNFQTFYYWLKKYDENPKTKPALSFTAMEPSKLHQCNQSQYIEIKLPNGVQCRFTMNTGIKQIAQITKELVDVISD